MAPNRRPQVIAREVPRSSTDDDLRAATGAGNGELAGSRAPMGWSGNRPVSGLCRGWETYCITKVVSSTRTTLESS